MTRDPVVTLCYAALVAAAVWACLVATSLVVELWRARAEGRRAQLLRAILVCCGIALAAPATPAAADGSGLAGLPYPDRAAGPAHAPPARTVVVQRGDCLWHLAEAALPPGAGPDRVAALTRRIYLLNRSTIGADPDLVTPGQRLVLPARHRLGDHR